MAGLPVGTASIVMTVRTTLHEVLSDVGPMTPIFTATVRGGKLVHADLNAVKRHLATLDGHDVEFTIKRKRSQRSFDQNAYCMAVPSGHLGGTSRLHLSQMKLC